MYTQTNKRTLSGMIYYYYLYVSHAVIPAAAAAAAAAVHEQRQFMTCATLLIPYSDTVRAHTTGRFIPKNRYYTSLKNIVYHSKRLDSVGNSQVTL